MTSYGGGHGEACLRDQLDPASPFQDERRPPRTGDQGSKYMGGLAPVLPERDSSTCSFLGGAGERVGHPGRHAAGGTPDDDASLLHVCFHVLGEYETEIWCVRQATAAPFRCNQLCRSRSNQPPISNRTRPPGQSHSRHRRLPRWRRRGRKAPNKGIVMGRYGTVTAD